MIESFLQRENNNLHKLLDTGNSESIKNYNGNFGIEVMNRDSLVYWNHQLKYDLQDLPFYFKEKYNGHQLLLSLFNPVDSIISKEIIDLSGSDFSFKLNSESNFLSSYELNFSGHTFSVIPVEFSNNNILSHLLILTLIGLFLFTLLYFLQYIVDDKTLLLWLVIAFSIRVLLYFLIASSEVTFEIFKPINQGGFLNKSIGDYLINLILILCSFLYILKSGIALKLQKWDGRVVSILNGILITSGFIYFYQMAKGFVLSEKIILDIDQVLSFNGYSILLIICFIVHNFILCLYVIHSFDLFKSNFNKANVLPNHTIGSFITLLAVYFFIPINPLILGAFILGYLTMADLFVDSNNKNVIWAIWWMIVHSLFIAILVYYYGLQKDNIHRKHQLENLISLSVDEDLKTIIREKNHIDTSGALLLLADLPYPYTLEKNDFNAFLKSNLSEDFSNEWYLSESYLLDNKMSSLLIGNKSSLLDLNHQLRLSESKMDNISYNPYEESYIIGYQIISENNPSTPFGLTLVLKKRASRHIFKKSDLIIARDDKIIFQENPQWPSSFLENIVKSKADFNSHGYAIAYAKLKNGHSAYSVKKVPGLIKPMSLFSYLFSIFGILIVAIGVLNSRYNFLTYPINLTVNRKTSLRNRIQLGVVAIIIFSFIIIGLLTAIYFKNVLETNAVEARKTQLQVIIDNLAKVVNTSDAEETSIIRLTQKLDELAPITNSSLTLYDSKGKSLSSSETESNELNFRIPYNVYNSLLSNSDLVSEDNSENNRNISYIPLLRNGIPFSFLSVESHNETDSVTSIYDFLSTLLNVYVFLFLLAGAIAIVISNSITKPLATLAIKLREFKLGKRNQSLQWNRNDEIGTLIKDYNNLVVQLEESADIIAKTERDTAWREMAKQVAHEIKNPLTPMKLSLQYLQKSIKESDSDPKPLIERVASTLIEQINNLSDIANEFSNFAKMPKSNNEKVVINEIVEAVHDLFRKREDMDIHLSEPINDLYVFVDRNQLVRILNNLVKNAIQAVPTDRRGTILISLLKNKDFAIVTVKDNGIGIPADMKDKVFTPNFTTKSSGTGLGLAISANIIEGFNGKIYFETEDGEGTTFFLEIPLMRLGENYDEGNRVTLD